jgi:myo-inositol 2-dehydrogenase/D-chiro-inositol 1-dehydrogenase
MASMSEQLASRPVRVGIIGTGGMGTRHALNIHRYVAGASLAGVFDVDGPRAAGVAAQAGGAVVFPGADALIGDERVDAVLIAAPDELHAGLVRACLAAGKPVLCEKPLANTVADASAIVAAEVAIGRRMIAVGYMRRFDPAHVAVKAVADSGEIGAPVLFKGVHRNAAADYGIPPTAVVIGSAGHDLDSARWMTGEEVVSARVFGLRTREDLHPDTRDLLVINLELTNGRHAVSEMDVNAGYGYEVSAELVCQHGTAHTGQADRVLVRGHANRGVPVAADWLDPFQEAYVAEIHDWIRSLRTGEPFAGASAWDGLATALTAAACIESLATGADVPVSLPPKPALYAR